MQCCNAKSRLQTHNHPATLCIAATRSLIAMPAFLDVSSLNLAALHKRRHFFCVQSVSNPNDQSSVRRNASRDNAAISAVTS
jgi:hypothetical protein